MPTYRVCWQEQYYIEALVEAKDNDFRTIKDAVTNLPEFHSDLFDGDVYDVKITVSSAEEEDE